MKFLKWLDEEFELAICSILMVIMTVLIFIQVIMRYVFGSSLVWSEEMARYVFIWLIYLGISYGARVMKHIKIEAALGLFPKKLRPFVIILGDVLFLVFSVVIVYLAYDVVMHQVKLNQKSPAMQIPMWFMYSAPMVGFALTAIRQIQVIFIKIKGIMKGGAQSW
ncbi:ectoine TRAP transporter small permease protein TeaB [Anaerotignum neopropionicum]|uniref:Ectoine TRAP transporter small permease protein TeaB n=1 Tax=Anaerotignum neopropionicum TaxID=36847 RepID=A0A136WE30_9FIRM|nr:TRAP transporter small permease [Anaerotignum neopropionicum]KXL52772.1 ectoine TRAP transporter small permease protein TeaB [Anaerotignum neopropionicum]